MNTTAGHENRWYETARVRFTQFAREKYGPGYAREEVELTKRYGCDTLLFFVEVDGWAIYPSRFAERDVAVRGGDLLGEIVAECRKNDIKVVAGFMGMHVQIHRIRRHPDWQLVHRLTRFPEDDPPKQPPGPPGGPTVCLNSPFREAVLGQVREVLEDYGVDGVYFDGVYALSGWCYCDYCTEKFRQWFLYEAPADQDNDDWRAFKRSYVNDFSRDVKEAIQKYRPGAILTQDCHGSLSSETEYIATGSKYVDVYILENYPECSGEVNWFTFKEALLVKAETRKTLWYARWLTTTSGCIHHAHPRALALGWFYDAVGSGSPPMAIDFGGFWHDRSLEADLGGACKRLSEFSPSPFAMQPIPYVALLHSTVCKEKRLRKDRVRERASFEGFFLALTEHHIPFRVVTEEDILSGGLKDFRALVLPNVEYMSDAVAEAIARFSEGGGGVVASLCTSFRDEKGNLRAEPALTELLGIGRVHGGIIRNNYRGNMSPDEYGWPISIEYANSYEVTEAHPVTEGLLADNVYSFTGTLAHVDPAPDARVLARVRRYDPEWMASGRFFKYVLTDLAEPLVLAREGKGRAVYFAGDMDQTFWSRGYVDSERLLTQAVAWAAAEEAPLRTDAPPTLAVRALEDDASGSLCVVFCNYATTAVMMHGNSPPNQYGVARVHVPRAVSPVKDTTVVLRTPGRKIAGIRSLTGQDIPYKQKKDELRIAVPLIEEGEAVLIRLSARGRSRRPGKFTEGRQR